MSALEDNSSASTSDGHSDNDFECNRNYSADSSNRVKKFVLEKLSMIQNHNYKVKNVVRFAKFLRCKLHLQKKPKKKGYEKFFTAEEKRYGYLPSRIKRQNNIHIHMTT